MVDKQRRRRDRAALLVIALLVSVMVSACGGDSKAGNRTPIPSLRIGWYTGERTAAAHLAAYQQQGVNLMVAYHAGEPYTSRWLAAACRHRIQVLLQPDPAWVRLGKIVALQRFVRRYQHSTAVHGWYLADEPDFTGLPPTRLLAAYRAIKAIDWRPVAVVFVTGECRFATGSVAAGYLGAFDLLMFDFYPFYRDIPSINPERQGRLVFNNCVAAARKYHKIGPIIVLQGFGQGQTDGPFHWRDPTLTEERCQVELALTAGATGLLFWDDQYADSTVLHNTARLIRQSRDARLGALSLAAPGSDTGVKLSGSSYPADCHAETASQSATATITPTG